MTKSTRAADLLKIIGQRTPPAPQPKPQPKPAPERTAPPSRKPKPQTRPRQAANPRRGRAVNIWMHLEDERLIRELSVWLMAHRRRVNDSLVVKTVLRAARTGAPLLAAYDEALRTDGRFRKPKPDRE